MAYSSGSKFVTLQSYDGETVNVEENIAVHSDLIRNLIEQQSDSDVLLPPLNVTGNVLRKMIDYIREHIDEDNPEKLKEHGRMVEDDVEDWDEVFLRVDHTQLYDLIVASHYLGIQNAFVKILGKVLDMIKGRSPDEIRGILHILNDFPPGEEQKVRDEHPWAFE